MTDDNEKKPRALGLSPAQVLGSALAAMSVAFFASWAGTAGTLIGAAFGSVIATVGAATYTWSLQRTSEAAKRTAAIVKQRALITGTLPRTVADGPLREGESDEQASPTDDPQSTPDPAPDAGGKSRWWDLPWAKLALASLAVMIAGMAGITVVEAVTGKPIASLFGRDDGTGTTVGHVIGNDNSAKQDDQPTERTPTTPTPSEEPSEQPQQPQDPEPSVTPTPTPSPSTDPDPVPPAETQVPAPDDTQP
jgi:hypothetical protein